MLISESMNAKKYKTCDTNVGLSEKKKSEFVFGSRDQMIFVNLTHNGIIRIIHDIRIKGVEVNLCSFQISMT